MATNKAYDAVPDATLACSVVLAYFLNRYFPVTQIISYPASLAGWLMVAAELGYAIYIIAMLRAKHTSSDATGMPSEFITSGFYSHSRNPFYLMYVITATGAAFIFGSLTAFVAPVICFAVFNFFIVPLEEENLREKFGKDYERYKSKVRRWI